MRVTWCGTRVLAYTFPGPIGFAARPLWRMMDVLLGWGARGEACRCPAGGRRGRSLGQVVLWWGPHGRRGRSRSAMALTHARGPSCPSRFRLSVSPLTPLSAGRLFPVAAPRLPSCPTATGCISGRNASNDTRSAVSNSS